MEHVRLECQANTAGPAKETSEEGETSAASGDFRKLKSRSSERKPFINARPSITLFSINGPDGFFKGRYNRTLYTSLFAV
jgi:hypothetical protein